MPRRKKAAAEPKAPTWRNRIVGYGSEAPGQLLANPGNWRIHPQVQQAALGGVLREVGIVQNIIVNRRTGHVVDGHLRVALAMREEQAEIPVTYVDLDEAEEAKVLATLDAITGWAIPDDGALHGLLSGIETEDAGLALLLDRLRQGEFTPPLPTTPPENRWTDPDATPEEPPSPRTRPGDLWALGGHRLICGDCTIASTVEAALDGAAPNLMVTDPPYGVSYDASWRPNVRTPRKDGGKFSSGQHATGAVRNDTEAEWTPAWRLFAGDVAYIWHAGTRAGLSFNGISSSGFEVRAQIVWAKPVHVIGRGHYHHQHEPCWYAVRKGKSGNWQGDRKQTTIWAIPNMHRTQGSVDDGKTSHSTQKPVECMRRPMLNNSSEGDGVYDPFVGSGTTVIAAEMEGRLCRAIEIDPIYCDVAIKRWQDFTGRKATRVSDGAKFDDVDPVPVNKDEGLPDEP